MHKKARWELSAISNGGSDEFLKIHLEVLYRLALAENNPQLTIFMKKYKVEIKYFSDKVYKVDNIQDILNVVKIFTDIEDIVNITEMTIE